MEFRGVLFRSWIRRQARSACELGDDAIGGEGRRIAGGVDILDDDAVSPALLGRVERRIGVTVELLERARAARLDGADAGGHRTIADRRAVIERRQFLPHAIDEADEREAVDPDYRQREFLAAEPGDGAARA